MISNENCAHSDPGNCPFKHCISECQHHTSSIQEPESETRLVETIETRYPVYDDWWNGSIPVKVTKTIQGGGEP